MLVQLTVVTIKLEIVIMKSLNVMMKTLALLIVAVLLQDANTPLLYVKINLATEKAAMK
jgi:hypothetical protein